MLGRAVERFRPSFSLISRPADPFRTEDKRGIVLETLKEDLPRTASEELDNR
jgi:hypothetical protein